MQAGNQKQPYNDNGRKTRAGNHKEENIERFEELGGQINIHRKYKIKFQINTKQDIQVDQNMMSQDHKENLNLLFYDFNNGAKLAQGNDVAIQGQSQTQNEFEAPSNMTNGQIYSMMNNTGSNFYQRFGDRLPTREVKSRRGRIGVISAA